MEAVSREAACVDAQAARTLRTALPDATSDTLALVKAVLHGVAKTWRDQGERPWRYSKAGVVTTDLMQLEDSPRALIGQMDRERSSPLMATIDVCNAR